MRERFLEIGATAVTIAELKAGEEMRLFEGVTASYICFQ